MAPVLHVLQVMVNYFPPESLPSDRAIMGMLLVPVTLLCFIKHLKILAWFSVVANIATLVALVIIFTYVFDVSITTKFIFSILTKQNSQLLADGLE